MAVTINPSTATGYPLIGALRCAQTVEHAGDIPEDELAEILLDQLTGVTRHNHRPPGAMKTCSH